MSAPAVSELPSAVMISGKLYAFLMGEADLDGVWFGEMDGGLPGRFWWRALLRCAAPVQTSDDQRATYEQGYRDGFVDAHVTDTDGFPDEEPVLRKLDPVAMAEGWEALQA